MEFSIKTGSTEKQHHNCVIVGVYESHQLSDSAKAIDDLSSGYLSSIIKRGDLDGKAEKTLMLHDVPGVNSERVLLVGLGKQNEFSEKQYAKAVRASVKAVAASGASEAVTYLAELPVKALSLRRKVSLLAEVALDATYRFNAIKRKKEAAEDDDAKKSVKRLTIHVTDTVQDAEAGLAEGKALAAGVSLTKDLGNLPPNVCTPTYLAEQALQLGKTYGLKVEVLEHADIEALGMGSFLGVTKGSEEPPKLIVMQHLKGKKRSKTGSAGR